MLDAKTKERIRRAAEAVSSDLNDEDRIFRVQAAHGIADSLGEEFGDDAVAARIAMMLAAVFASLNSLPVRALNETLDSSMDAYTFAAGKLAGVYGLPERQDVPPEEVIPPFSPSTTAGPYL